MAISEFAQHYGAGWKVRQDRAEAKATRNTDPIRMAINAIRTCNGFDVRGAAEAEFKSRYTMTRSPIPAEISSDVADLLADFLASHNLIGVDLTKPLAASETVEDIAARIGAEIARQHAEATAALAQHEREAAVAQVREAQAKLDAVDNDHRVRGVAPAEASSQIPSGTDEPPRRGPGRPRKQGFIDISELPSD